MISNIFCILLLTVRCLSFDLFEEAPAKGPTLSRLLSGGIWTFMGRIQGGYMLPYPRVGRHTVQDLEALMTPSQRTGRQANGQQQTPQMVFQELNELMQNVVNQDLSMTMNDMETVPNIHSDAGDVISPIGMPNKIYFEEHVPPVVLSTLPKQNLFRRLKDLSLLNSQSDSAPMPEWNVYNSDVKSLNSVRDEIDNVVSETSDTFVNVFCRGQPNCVKNKPKGLNMNRRRFNGIDVDKDALSVDDMFKTFSKSFYNIAETKTEDINNEIFITSSAKNDLDKEGKILIPDAVSDDDFKTQIINGYSDDENRFLLINKAKQNKIFRIISLDNYNKEYGSTIKSPEEDGNVGAANRGRLKENSISNLSGFDIMSEDKRQGLIPLPRFGRHSYWTLVEEKKQSGGMMPYPRLGREVILELPQTVIPYPRAGRTLADGDDLFYGDYELVPVTGFEEWLLAPAPLDNGPIIKKRGKLAFTPRIGRRKRSTTEEDPQRPEDRTPEDRPPQKPHPSTSSRPFDLARWADEDMLEDSDLEDDLFFRPSRQFRSRNAFVPRVGKRRSDPDKRALAFTPRIGRAALIPRIGRNGDRVMSRGAFIPRLGRRANAGVATGAEKAADGQSKTQ